MKSLFPLLLFASILFACSQSSPLESALKFAGNNRQELEKTLNHYAANPADSLKYRAACFLIENMPYHYAYKNKTDEIVQDAQVITGEYLIRNIEMAFKVWEEKSWKNAIGFDDFCEQILPYKIENEPIEDWRELYYHTFQPVLDSLQTNKNDLVEAIQILYDTLNRLPWTYYDIKPIYYLDFGPVQLLHNPMGNCFDFADLGAYTMRALGIPGGIDRYLQSPNGDGGRHAHNFATDTLGNVWEFSLSYYSPRSAKRKEHAIGRIYRKCFGLQVESLPVITKGKKDIPPLLNNAFIKDVSEKYLDDLSIVIKANRKTTRNTILYLCAFAHAGWTPVAWTTLKDNEYTFNFVDENTLYLPAYYRNGQLVPASDPVYATADGRYFFVHFDNSKTQKLLLEKKYPVSLRMAEYQKRIIDGQFQVADYSDFRNATTLHTFKKTTDMRWHTIEFPSLQKYRYFRYLSGKDGYCNMAEIQLFSQEKRTLQGEIIGTEAGKKAVFDGDPLTFFDSAEKNGSWAGLDFGKPESITKISYLFRNDDNNIRIGDVYELFYRDNIQWNSLGRKVADSDILEFDNCPIQAVFWLRNLTRGSEERIFIYENGKQVFL
jgi:hypothetical protein